MPSLSSLNKKLNKLYNGAIRASVQRGRLVLQGEHPHWDDIVSAGLLAAKKGPKNLAGVVNDVHFTGGKIPPMRLPALHDDALQGLAPDVLVIGAGVSGAAIARELSRQQLDVLWVDKECDVALHASSRNDGMVHPGLDLKKGTQKHHYNMRGNAMYAEVCKELGVPFERTGQYLCFRNKLLVPFLHAVLLHFNGLGIPGGRVVAQKELRQLQPHLAPDVSCALFFPSAGIVCPYNLVIAMAESAVQNGVHLSLNTAVTSMELADDKIQSVHTNRGTVYPTVVINAAGVFCEDVAGMANDRFYSIHPRKGTNSILDKKYSATIVDGIASVMRTSSAKSSHTKGGGIVATVHGNLLIGPDAKETYEKEDFSTEHQSIKNTFERQRQTSHNLNQNEIITYFAGVRAATFEEDFTIRTGLFTKNLIHVAGIQSPGLTAAPAIALDVADMTVNLLQTSGMQVHKNPSFSPVRVPIPHLASLSASERAKLIAQNPDYGLVLCRCEEVSKGEILDAIRRPVPCNTIDGVKRRVRPGSGRCQGSFCQPLIAQIIAEEQGLPLHKVRKSGEGSELLSFPTKQGGEAHG